MAGASIAQAKASLALALTRLPPQLFPPYPIHPYRPLAPSLAPAGHSRDDQEGHPLRGRPVRRRRHKNAAGLATGLESPWDSATLPHIILITDGRSGTTASCSSCCIIA